MAIPKYCGLETEYGIALRGVADPNPIAASAILITAYLAALTRDGGAAHGAPSVGWDFIDETPGHDARGFATTGSLPPEVETHMVNAVLTNGARYYVDHAHPELSTPECADARSAVVFDRAADRILERSMRDADAVLPPGQSIVVYKNNSDGKGNSYGCHENYLMARDVAFNEIARFVTPHFVTRQIFCGAGKVGSEVGRSVDEVPFQVSQRADFFEEEIGLETTLKRPIVNTRDEPHADPSKYRRLHVIVGDANMSETATFLKVGTTMLLLCMIEDGVIPDRLTLRSPVPAIRAVSTDLTLRGTVELHDGTRITPLELQRELHRLAVDWTDANGFDCVGGATGADVLREWEFVLDGLERDPASVADRVDWVAKLRLVDGYRDRHGLPWDDARLRALDLQYHDLRSERSLAARVGLATIVDDDEIERAVTEPPTDTRAYFRGRCVDRFGDQVVSANWDSIVFDVGSGSLRRVPMMEPGRGTAAHVASVLDGSSDAADLLDRLGS